MAETPSHAPSFDCMIHTLAADYVCCVCDLDGQGETLSKEKEHSAQSNLLERTVIILDFEFLISGDKEDSDEAHRCSTRFLGSGGGSSRES